MSTDMQADTAAALRGMYASGEEVAKRFFDWAAGRQNDATQTSIDHLSYKTGADRRDVIELARELERIGCGQFVVGRRGARSRIIWDLSLKSIGRVAQGGGKLAPIDPELRDETVGLDDGASGNTGPLTIAEAKQRLAAALGVSEHAIEITVRA